MTPKTRSHNFILILDGIEPGDGIIEDGLFEAGCDDALLSFRGSTALLEFDREAKSLEEAVLSAFRDLDATGFNATVLRVEPDDLVTASEIARRAGGSREAVRLWHEGKRGPGCFPPPMASVGGHTVLWSWAEVSGWLLQNGKLNDRDLVESAQFFARLNALLSEERYQPLVAHDSNLRERVGKTGVLKRLRNLAKNATMP